MEKARRTTHAEGELVMQGRPRPRFEDVPALVVIVLMCALILIAFPSVPFLNDSYCDPWYIFGSFYLLPDMAHWRPETRQIARLPEILPGYLFTHLFHGITADYALFLSYYGASLALLYKTVRLLITRGTALLALIFFAAHPLIIGNYSVTMDAPAIVYNIATLYFLSRAIVAEKRSQKLWMVFASSLTLGMAIHAHLGMASFAFANYLIFFCCELSDQRTEFRGRIRVIFLSCGVTILGLGIVTCLCGLWFAVVLDGSFLQSLNQFFQIVKVSRSNAEHYLRPNWYLGGAVAGMLACGALISLLNVLVLGRGSGRLLVHDEVRRRILAISIATLVLIIAQLCYSLEGGIFVEYDYYYVFFVPYICIIIFSPVAVLNGERWVPSHRLIGFFLIAAIGAISIKWQTLPWLYGSPRESFASLALAIIAASIYGLSIWTGRGARYSSALYLATAIAMLVTIRPEAFGVHIWTENASSERRDTYVRIRRGMEFLSHLHFVADSPKFWVDDRTDGSELAAYPRSYYYCTFHQFPELDPSRPEQFLPNDDVVVIARASDLSKRARDAFSKIGLAVSETAKSIIAFKGHRYEIVVEHVGERVK